LVEPEVIENRIRQLQGYLEKLSQLARTDKKDFLSDFRNVESTKYLLQVSIECCLDIANHIIASEKYRSPADYADSFRILHEHNIISDSQIGTLVEKAKFRNRLVHVYWEINDDLLHEIVRNNLNDFNLFIKAIIELL